MANKAQSTFSQLPMWAKGTIAVVGVLVFVGVGYFIYKKVSRIGQNKDEKQEVGAAKDELENLKKQGITPTFTESDARGKANALQVAADGCDMFGTGATEIMNIIYSIKNAADWQLLKAIFGVRSWSDCLAGVQGSITTLLLEELDTTQMKEARRHLGQFGISL